MVKEKLLSISVPETLMTCEEAPAVPDPDIATQRQAAAFTVGLYESWQDCHDNLAAVRQIIEEQNSKTP